MRKIVSFLCLMAVLPLMASASLGTSPVAERQCPCSGKKGKDGSTSLVAFEQLSAGGCCSNKGGKSDK